MNLRAYQQMLQIISDVQSSGTICRCNKLYDSKMYHLCHIYKHQQS